MPPKKNKKPSKNGYWQFVLECRDKHPNKNLEEAQGIASRKWANMTKEEKRPYEEMAGLARHSFRTVKLTSDGCEIDEVERQEKEAENRIQQMKHDIVKRFRTASIAGTLEDHVFILIHINHLTYYPAEDRYIICEVAMASVSLQDGIKDMYHAVVKPGKLPLGFYGPALAHSKETHQLLDIVQDEPYDNNTGEVFYEMISFLKKHTANRPFIVYSDEKTFEMTTNVFENFQREFEFNDEIRVYNMQYMFFALKNAAAGKTVWPTETYSYYEIEKDVYCFSPNIGCEFHEMTDNTTYCSKSIVTRYAYIICDNCCTELGIGLIPGCHVASNVKVPNEPIKLSSRSTSMSSVDQSHYNRGETSSISSRGYEDNYPPLRSSRSSASSLISFSSMKTHQPRSGLTVSNVAALEDSAQSTSSSPPKRNHRNMKFPEKGSKPSQ